MTLKEQGIFLIRTSDMLDNGFTLSEALQFLSRLNRKGNEVLQSLLIGLQKGQPIHEVFYEQKFDSQACAQIFFAEKHGFLSEAFHESGQYLIRKDEERKKLLKLMQYPLILLFIVLFVTILLKTLLLPRFQLLYGSMGYEPSPSIRIVLHFMEKFPYYLLAILFIVLTTSACSSNETSVINPHLKSPNSYSSLPLFNSFYKLYQTIFFSREWSFLLRSGFSMNEVLTIMETQSFRPLLQETAEEIKKRLLIGSSFSNALSNLCFFEKEMILIVGHGEQNRRLESELLYYSNICLQRLEEKTLKIFMVIQPIIFIFIGLMVAAIYMSIFLPMFQVFDTI